MSFANKRLKLCLEFVSYTSFISMLFNAPTFGGSCKFTKVEKNDAGGVREEDDRGIPRISKRCERKAPDLTFIIFRLLARE